MPIKKRTPLRKPPPKAKLTKSFVESLPTFPYDYLVADIEVPRLKVKVTPAGNRSFLIRYRNSFGREKKFKLGDFPDMSVTLARHMAARHLNNIAAGLDPADERAKKRHGLTLNELFQRFLEEYGQFHLRPSTVKGYRQLHRANIANSLGKRPISSITRNDLLQFHRDHANTPYTANRLIALIRRLYNWAENIGLCDDHNPATGVKPYTERAVERLLTKEETERLAQALDYVRTNHPGSDASLNAIVFMFFTGCRRSEALRMRWDELDFDRKSIAFIGAKSGDRKQHMSEELHSWLDELHERATSEHLFPGAVVGQPLKDIKRTWEMVRRRAGLPELRLHDIRHNVLSDIAASSDLATAQSVGGHKSIRSTMRYIHSRSSTAQSAINETGKRVRSTFLDRGKIDEI
ncbi:site-specific integrase [Ruegeria faecimaris]|uniref:site-specific integrase n=1 Tax=Ruegeria faecimaris TaxID=686389 RepID=UPI0023308C9D|nr:site-specific integrase [Ruegeria faecimaris]